MSFEAIPEMLEEPVVTRRPARRSLRARILGNRFLFISIAVHLLFAFAAAVVVVQRYAAARQLTFKGGPPSPNRSTRAMEHKVQMAKKQSTMSAPATKRIVSTGISKVTLPEMPAMPKTATVPSKMAGVGGASMGAAGGPMGGAGSQGGGGLVSMFGLREARGGGLPGTFYDLKQSAGKQPTKMDPKAFGEAMATFVKDGWNEAALNAYYKAPGTLYSHQFLIPKIAADEGPKAFQVEKDVQPRMWAALYKGEVIAPESGTFHFVGAGDDIMFVRFNKITVLDARYEKRDSSLAKDTGRYNYENIGHPGGFTKGDAIQVDAGRSYPIEILIGEQPGGHFYSVLFIEKSGASYQKTGGGSPILPAFRTADIKPAETEPGKELKLPPFDPKGLIWRASGAKKGLDIFRR